MIKINFTALALLSLISLPSIAAEDKPFEITPLIGYRFGGDFEIKSDDGTQGIKAKEDVSYGLLFAWPYDNKRQNELILSHYDTKLSKTNGIFSPTEPDNGDVDAGLAVTYFHVGGNVPVTDGSSPVRISGGLGLTYLSPHDDKLNSETKFSMNLGLNKKFPLSESISFRLGSRLYGTFFNSDSATFCGPDKCGLYVSSSVWVQAEVNAGLTFAF